MRSDWDRVAADAALLEDVRRRYRGSGDVADQLWWIQHPGTPAQSGAPDPEVELTAARRALYRQDVRPDEALAAVESAARLLDDRALARLALVDALAAREPEAPAAPTRASRRPDRTRLVGAALAVSGLAVGVLLGTALPTPPPAPTGAAFDVLRAAQRQQDRLADDLRPAFVAPGSTRLLTRYSTIGTSVYAARSTNGAVCLLTIAFAERLAGACATEADFTSHGLFVVLQATGDPVDEQGRLAPDEHGLRWRADGTLLLSS